jgi:hypothetical protein
VTDEQREKFVQHVGNGAKFGEAAGMVGVKVADPGDYWRTGVRGEDPDAETFVADCRAARARYCATTRATAEAAAGSRESPDLLAVVREVEADLEPVAEEASRALDLIDYAEHEDRDTRAAAIAAQHVCREVVHALAAFDARKRDALDR